MEFALGAGVNTVRFLSQSTVMKLERAITTKWILAPAFLLALSLLATTAILAMYPAMTLVLL